MKNFAEACELFTIGFGTVAATCLLLWVSWKTGAMLSRIPCGGWLLAGLGGATLVTIIGAGAVSLWRKRHDHSR